MNPIVWRVEHFAQIDSTNSWLAEQARQGAPEGAVVVADFQTAGRGRLDRTWEARAGSSLLCSILLRPSLETEAPQWSVAIVALAARAAIVRLCGHRPTLKWPNDLMVGDGKLAGLLAELVSTPVGPAVVVGIGVNLLDDAASNPRATSIERVAGVSVSAPALLDILLEELEPRRLLLDTTHGRDAVRDEYSAALSTIGTRVRIELNDNHVSGVAKGIDEFGHLVVDVDGVAMTFAAGDVVHLRDEA